VTGGAIDEAKLFRRTTGNGPDIVFCHGFAGSARNWGVQVRALEATHRCTVYDARGHARSETPADPLAFAFERLVVDLGNVIDDIGEAARVVIVALSLGAATALEFAIREPARVAALLVASPPPAGEGRRRWALDFADAIEREGPERAGERFVWGARTRLDTEGASAVRRGFLEHDARALAQLLRHAVARTPGLEEQALSIDRLAIPMVVVAGEADGPGTAAARQLAAAVRNADLVVVPGAGHVVNLAAPGEFLAAIRRTLSRANWAERPVPGGARSPKPGA
jgi:3-oxoadipate enol-lactonase